MKIMTQFNVINHFPNRAEVGWVGRFFPQDKNKQYTENDIWEGFVKFFKTSESSLCCPKCKEYNWVIL